MPKIVLGPPENDNIEEDTLYFFQVKRTEEKKGELTTNGTLRVKYKEDTGEKIDQDASNFLSSGAITSILLDIHQDKPTIAKAISNENIRNIILTEGPLSSKMKQEDLDIHKQKEVDEKVHEKEMRKIENDPLIKMSNHMLDLISNMHSHAAAEKSVPKDVLSSLLFLQTELKQRLKSLTESVIMLQLVKNNKYKYKMHEMFKMHSSTGGLINYRDSKKAAQTQVFDYADSVLEKYKEIKQFISEHKIELKPVLLSRHSRQISEKAELSRQGKTEERKSHMRFGRY